MPSAKKLRSEPSNASPSSPAKAGDSKTTERAELIARRAKLREEYPEFNYSDDEIEHCGFCGLLWHSENHPDGRPRCDLKIRQLEEAYVGSALAHV